MPRRDDSVSTPTALRVCVLASGSSGNAVLVSDGPTTVLIDAGISARELYRRAALCGIDAGCISAIVVTHEHGDHLRGVRVLAKRTGAVVYSSEGTRRAGGLDALAPDVRALRIGESTRVGTLGIVAFHTSHDAAEPIGVRVEGESEAFGLMTDTGHMPPEAREALAGCGTLGIETNHDLDMLEHGPYPYFLKQRVRSHVGHLANTQAADALESLAHDGLRRVFALHVSRTNNSYSLAERSLAVRLAGLGLDVPVRAGRHDEPCDSAGQSTLFEAAR